MDIELTPGVCVQALVLSRSFCCSPHQSNVWQATCGIQLKAPQFAFFGQPLGQVVYCKIFQKFHSVNLPVSRFIFLIIDI